MRGATVHHIFFGSNRKFQSTLPMRGATIDSDSRAGQRSFQSTLPMRGATLDTWLGVLLRQISIHAPHAGSDNVAFWPPYVTKNFNPRSPCGERRHTLNSLVNIFTNFNPRSPCGERRDPWKTSCESMVFQSTLPMRGATRGCVK